MQTVTRAHAEAHYADLSARPFFAGLVEYSARPAAAQIAPYPSSRVRPVCSGPVVCMVWSGLDVVKQGRAMIGATNPLASAPGTIRGDFCIVTGRNIIHGSDAVESAKHEIGLWFPEGVNDYTPCTTAWKYE